MSRIRSIHPGFFRDEDLVSCSGFARLLFLGLTVEADDKGIFEWKPVQIKMTVFPGDNVDVAALLDELVKAGNVRAFDSANKRYGAIRNFRKYQRPKTPNDIHPMPNDIAVFVGFPLTGETHEHDDGPFLQKGEIAPQMEEVGGEEEGKKEISLEAEREFEVWYGTFPKHVGKGAARVAYRRARKKAPAEVLLGGAVRATTEFAGKEPQFIPHPATWLNGERWLDQPPKPQASWKDDPIMRGVL